MRISGTEPSSVILRQKSSLKVELMPQKCQIKLKPKGMVKLTHKITISDNFNTNILLLSNATNQPK